MLDECVCCVISLLHVQNLTARYVPTIGPMVYHLLSAYDIDPTKFVDGALNIPQSGNGVPDVLDVVVCVACL